MKDHEKRSPKRKFVFAVIAPCVLAFLFTTCDLFPPETEAAPELVYEEDDIELSAEGFPKTLKGLVYIWFGGWGNRTITFHTETSTVGTTIKGTCTFVDDLREYYHSDDPSNIHTFTDNWTYNNANGRGNITGGFSPGRFELRSRNSIMYFLSFSVYGHGATFTRSRSNP